MSHQTRSAQLLPLTLDELLTTTRAVRKRLDLERPVDRSVVEECLQIAVQAPTASYAQLWHFIVVTDPGVKSQIADLYRGARDIYPTLPTPKYYTALPQAGPEELSDDPDQAALERMQGAARYLTDNLERVPVFLIPCVHGRTDGLDSFYGSGQWGTIVSATWSFMLAARARGLGTCWTSLHLIYEREASEILGIPYDDVMQCALIPVAYTKGTDFKPGYRKPLDSVVHWERW